MKSREQLPSALALDDVPTSSGEVRVDGRQPFLPLEADPFFLIFRGLARAGRFCFPSRSEVLGGLPTTMPPPNQAS